MSYKNEVININNKIIYNVDKDEILLCNNILNEEELLCIKNKIKNDISQGNNFKLNIDNEEKLWKKDLSLDPYYTKNVFDVLKRKINKNIELLNVECKIQRYGDNEEYHIDNINDKHLSLNLQLYINEDIIQTHDKEEKMLALIYDNTKTVKHQIKYPVNDIVNLLEDNLNEFNIIDKDKYDNIDKLMYKSEFYQNKQNMFDEQGHLYIIPPDEPYIHTFEFTDNTCVVYPSFFFNKSKPFLMSSKNIRVSILFYCLLYD